MKCLLDIILSADGKTYFPIAAQVLATLFAVIVTVVGFALQLRGIPPSLVLLSLSRNDEHKIAIGFYTLALFASLFGCAYPSCKFLAVAYVLTPLAIILLGNSACSLFSSILGDKQTRELTSQWVRYRVQRHQRRTTGN